MVEDEFSLIMHSTGHVPGDPTGQVPGDPPPPGDRSIHDQESIRYYKEELKLNNGFWKLWLRNITSPSSHALLSITRKIINQQTLKKRFSGPSWFLGRRTIIVTRVTKRPRCTNPMWSQRTQVCSRLYSESS